MCNRDCIAARCTALMLATPTRSRIEPTRPWRAASIRVCGGVVGSRHFKLADLVGESHLAQQRVDHCADGLLVGGQLGGLGGRRGGRSRREQDDNGDDRPDHAADACGLVALGSTHQ